MAVPDHGLVFAIVLVMFHILEQLLNGWVRKSSELSSQALTTLLLVCLHAQP
jgi:hypothetical protein